MGLEILPGYGFANAVRALFSEYTQMLVAREPSFQGFYEIPSYNDSPVASTLYMRLDL